MGAIHAALEAERRVGGIVGGGPCTCRPSRVEALRNIRGAETASRLSTFAKEIVEHVAPVANHVEDDAAGPSSVAIIPRWPLRLLPAAFEPNPVNRIRPRTESIPAEEAGIPQECQPSSAPAGTACPCNGAVLDAPGVGKPDDRHPASFEIGPRSAFPQ